MKRLANWNILAASVLGVLAAPVAAQSLVAAPTENSARLGQCLVDNSTGRDRTIVARWMGASLAASPRMEGLIALDKNAKVEADKAMAQLFTRLLTKDCEDEARAVLAERSPHSMQAAGGRLGEIAMRELMMDPVAMQALTAYAQYVDPAAIASLSE